jgi:thymidine phosphorylase
MGDTLNYLEDGMPLEVVFYEGKAISVELPTSVEREITWTEPAVKGDTSGKVLKPAKIATGFEIGVPIFVAQGDKVEIDTRTGEYRNKSTPAPASTASASDHPGPSPHQRARQTLWKCWPMWELPIEQLQDIVRAHRGCLAWGGTTHLSPADDVLISVERPLSLDSPGQMVASILSKKISAGSSHLVLDIPIGPTAKVRSMPEAQRLRRLFEYVARRMQLSLDVVITDGRQPIGFGIGPVLEARDVMRVLENDPRAPMDLRQKSLRLAGRLIECDPDVRGGDGFAIARDILDSGRALARMNDIIQAQGSKHFDHNQPELGSLSFEVRAPHDGMVISIDNLQLAAIAGRAGAPKVKGAGVDLLCKLGDDVHAGTLLYRVHASYPSDLEFARQACKKNIGYAIGNAADMLHAFVEF